MNGYLLDTHVWLWATRNAVEEVSSEFFVDLDGWNAEQLVHLSPFSCWEVSLLEDKGQIVLQHSPEVIWETYLRVGYKVAPLTPQVLIEANRLPGDIHRDPADRILAATAREYDFTLVTRDKALLQYAKQGHIKARMP